VGATVPTQQRALCFYLNTSILIRALEDAEAGELLRECCSRHWCIISGIHWLENWRRETREAVTRLLEELGVDVAEFFNHVVSRINRRARLLIRNHGWSPRRTLDLMHVLAALRLDCDGIIAVDRFIARRAKEYGLLYVNQYTGCPENG